MKFNFSFSYVLVALLMLSVSEKAAAQTKEELNELKNSTPAKAETTKKEEKVKELPDPQKISWRKNKKIADKLIQRGSIYKALSYYESAISQKPKKTFLNQNIADGNFRIRDYRTANRYYKTLVDLDSVKHKNLNSLYQYALTDKYLGNYEQSKASFSKFIKLAKDVDALSDLRKSASKELQGCDLAISLRDKTDLPEFKVTHLNENINQPLTDFSPVLKDANTLYYGSWTADDVIFENKVEKYATFSKLYMASKSGNSWSKGEVVSGGINDAKFHTGNPAITADGKTIYFTQCFQDDIQRIRCSIYKSSASANGWSAGEKLDANVNAEGFTATHPALGKNEAGEDVLYFSSDRNPGKGMDLFYAKINADGSMAKAKSVGPTINTRGDEMTPYYESKTGILYFCSNGHVNIGGTDIFKTMVDRGEWAEPQNMGMPINSSVDDMYYVWNENESTGFVVSNRPGGFGLKSETCCDDIYEVGKTRLYFGVVGTMKNADSSFKYIDNGLVTLYDNASGEQVKTFYSKDGNYFFDLEPEKEYKIIARKKDFEDMILSVSTVGKRQSDTVMVDFAMKEIPGSKNNVGQTIGVVYWEFDKDNLMKGAADTLNQVVAFMMGNPDYVLEVGSHTDGKGTEEYNLKLSQRRSDAVLKYLLSKKIQKYRLQSKAYGEAFPVFLNEDPEGTDNPEGRTKNRRTEFKVVGQLTPAELEQKTAEESPKKPTKKNTEKPVAPVK